MKRTLLLAMLASSFSWNAQAANGTMDCLVTGAVVVASEEGKFKTYSSIEGGVKANDRVILKYQVSNDSILITVSRDADNKAVISSYLSTRTPTTTAEKNPKWANSDGFVISDSRYGETISFSSEYIRIKSLNELFISRYYKNDWHGIFVAVNQPGNYTQTLTLNCRETNNALDDALKDFTDYKVRK